jgi:hypothetical protein
VPWEEEDIYTNVEIYIVAKISTTILFENRCYKDY